MDLADLADPQTKDTAHRLLEDWSIPEPWMRVAAELEKALPCLSSSVKTSSSSLGKTCQTWHRTVTRTKDLFALGGCHQ